MRSCASVSPIPSRIALGTVQFGQRYGIANSSGQVDLSEAQAMLDYARRASIDTLDTAVIYGVAEERLGELGVGDFRVITKLPALTPGVTLSGRWLLDQVEASIRRLKVEKLYGLLLHHPKDLLGASGQSLAEQLRAIKTLGLVEKIGASIYSSDDLSYIEPLLPLDIVQAPMNVFDHRLERSGWLARLVSNGVEIHVRSIFLQGLLIMPEERIPPKFDPWRKLFTGWHEWLAGQGLSAVEACVAHVASYSDVARIIVGCDSLEHLDEVVRACGHPRRTAPLDFECNDERVVNPAMWNTL